MHCMFTGVVCCPDSACADQMQEYLAGSTAHRTCITFNYFFYFLSFPFSTFWCSFSPLWLTLSCFSLLPPKRLPQFLSPHRCQLFCIFLPVRYFWCHCWCTRDLAQNFCCSCLGTVCLVWLLTRRSPVLPFNYLWSSAIDPITLSCLWNPAILTALPIKFICFSLCYVSVASHFLFMFAWVVLACPVQLALTPARAQAAVSLLSWALVPIASSLVDAVSVQQQKR